jgi:hypothetical protein
MFLSEVLPIGNICHQFVIQGVRPDQEPAHCASPEPAHAEKILAGRQASPYYFYFYNVATKVPHMSQKYCNFFKEMLYFLYI